MSRLLASGARAVALGDRATIGAANAAGKTARRPKGTLAAALLGTGETPEFPFPRHFSFGAIPEQFTVGCIGIAGL